MASVSVGYVLKRFPRLTQTFVLEEILAHERAACRVVVFSLRDPYPEDRHPGYEKLAAEVVRVEGIDDLVPEASRRGVRHLHAHFANIATDVARGASARLRIPYSLTLHARDIFHESVDPSALRDKIEGSSVAVTVSEFNAGWLRREVAPEARIEVVRNGLPIADLPFAPPIDREPLVVAVGRLVEKKGFDTLIRAFRDLRPTAPLRGEIVGAGPLAESLERMIRDFGLADRVRLTGALPPERVRDRIRRASVLAAPCRVAADGDRDGLPTVLLEAMALGTPCVATPVTAIPELIQDGATGLLVPADDAERLALACGRLVASPGLSVALATAARRRVEERYDANRNAARLRSLWWGATA